MNQDKFQKDHTIQLRKNLFRTEQIDGGRILYPLAYFLQKYHKPTNTCFTYQNFHEFEKKI